MQRQPAVAPVGTASPPIQPTVRLSSAERGAALLPRGTAEQQPVPAAPAAAIAPPAAAAARPPFDSTALKKRHPSPSQGCASGVLARGVRALLGEPAASCRRPLAQRAPAAAHFPPNSVSAPTPLLFLRLASFALAHISLRPHPPRRCACISFPRLPTVWAALRCLHPVSGPPARLLPWCPLPQP